LKSTKKIEAQNRRITEGEKLENEITSDIWKKALKILEPHSKVNRFYCDVFYKRQLVRIKFEINKVQNYKLICEEIYNSVKKDYRIKEISYLEKLDENKSLLIIWL